MRPARWPVCPSRRALHLSRRRMCSSRLRLSVGPQRPTRRSMRSSLSLCAASAATRRSMRPLRWPMPPSQGSAPEPETYVPHPKAAVSQREASVPHPEVLRSSLSSCAAAGGLSAPTRRSTRRALWPMRAQPKANCTPTGDQLRPGDLPRPEANAPQPEPMRPGPRPMRRQPKAHALHPDMPPGAVTHA